VKTLVLGVIGEPVIEGGEQKVHGGELSYTQHGHKGTLTT
jgi:hypothetical protein